MQALLFAKHQSVDVEVDACETALLVELFKVTLEVVDLSVLWGFVSSLYFIHRVPF